MRGQEIRILEQRLKDLSVEIGDIEQEIEHANPKLRETYNARLKSIRQRRRTVQERLAELRLQKALSWEQSTFATGVERVLDRIGRGLDRITTRRH